MLITSTAGAALVLAAVTHRSGAASTRDVAHALPDPVSARTDSETESLTGQEGSQRHRESYFVRAPNL